MFKEKKKKKAFIVANKGNVGLLIRNLQLPVSRDQLNPLEKNKKPQRK